MHKKNKNAKNSNQLFKLKAPNFDPIALEKESSLRGVLDFVRKCKSKMEKKHKC
jgi:hypothetical protein